MAPRSIARNICFGPQPTSPLSPENTVIAFDLHRVIFHRSWRDAIRYGLRVIRHKKEMLLLLLNPLFWIRAAYARYKTGVSDDIYERLAAKYPRLKKFKNEFIALENIQKAAPAMVTLINDLKNRGFTIILLSNIGERAYADIKAQNPSVFALFDLSFSPKKELNYLQKPQHAFYEKFLEFLAHHGYKNKHVLFIDDNKRNVRAAAKAGISAILFKSSDQLQKILARMF